MDFSCSLNIFILALQLDQAAPICSWMSDFLSDRKQRAGLGRHISDSPSTLVLLEAAFLSLYQKAAPQSVNLLKFEDDTES